jgi:peptidoglycan/LPS O-acetylase OafA/YrhL
MQKIYFKGFNEIRAIAALSVLLHHIELYKNRMGIPTLYDTYLKTFVNFLGENGVSVFFALSGFLITYLLLAEKESGKKINIKKFYIRRVLRIWPVYYIVVIIGFVLIPYLSGLIFFEDQIYYNSLASQLNWAGNLFLFLLFFSNLAMHLYPKVAGASQSWSVSVEEQFYVIWPWIVRFTKEKLPYVLIIIIIGYKLLAENFRYIEPYCGKVFKYWFYTFKVQFLATGALGAYFYMYKKTVIIRFQELKWLNITIFLLLIIHLLINLDDMIFALCSTYLILLSASGKGISNKLLDRIGIFSYGLYMYHPLIMYIVFSIVIKVFNPQNNLFAYNILLYVLMLALTFLVSHMSFKYIEKPILNFKEKFSKFRTQ